MIERRYWPVSVSVSSEAIKICRQADLECLCQWWRWWWRWWWRCQLHKILSPYLSLSLPISPHLTCHLWMLSSDHCQPLVLSISISPQSSQSVSQSVDTRRRIKNVVIKGHQGHHHSLTDNFLQKINWSGLIWSLSPGPCWLLLVDCSQSDETRDLTGATPVGKWLNDWSEEE